MNEFIRQAKAQFQDFNAPWKRETADELRERFRAGERIDDIAQDLQRSPGGVRMKLIGMGEIFGFLGRDGQEWSDSEDERLCRFFSQGYDTGEIARMLGRRKEDVRKRYLNLL